MSVSLALSFPIWRLKFCVPRFPKGITEGIEIKVCEVLETCTLPVLGALFKMDGSRPNKE